jgi:hypothetical protein
MKIYEEEGFRVKIEDRPKGFDPMSGELQHEVTVLGVSVRTVLRDWKTARLWLYRELSWVENA